MNAFSEAAQSHFQQLCSTAAAKWFRRGVMIPLTEEHIWIVYQGYVRLENLSFEGEAALLSILSPLMPFGLPLTQLEAFNAYGLTDVRLIQQSLSDIHQSPMLIQWLNQQVTQRLQQTEAMLAMLGNRRVEARLRQFLILLAQEIGEPTEVGIRLPIRLTHQTIATATATSRVTVTRILGQLQREDWLRMDSDTRIVLTQMPLM